MRAEKLIEKLEAIEISASVAGRCLARQDVDGVRLTLRGAALHFACALREIGEMQIAGVIERELWLTSGMAANG